MRAVTLHQPWATGVAWRLKVYETRTWKIAQGPLAIHAAALRSNTHRDFYYAEVCPLARRQGRQPVPWAALPFGVVIATCRVAACLPAQAVPRDDQVLGDFSPGRWAWRLLDVVVLEQPVPARGHQQLWEWR